MEKGFIRDMLDVKTLILFVMRRSRFPASLQDIYEMCYQDDRLSYFDVSIAVPDLVQSGHLAETGHKKFEITKKGMEAESVTADAIAFPVKERAVKTVEQFNAKAAQQHNIRVEQTDKEYRVKVELNDELGNLMRLDLLAANAAQAERLRDAAAENTAGLYRAIMEALNRAKM